MPCTEYGNAHMHMYVAPHIDFPFELTFAATILFVDRLSFHYNINYRQNMLDTLFNGTKMTEQKNYTLEAAGKNIVHKKNEKKATTWPSNINETVSDIKIGIFVVWPSLASIFTYLAIVYLCFCFCFCFVLRFYFIPFCCWSCSLIFRLLFYAMHLKLHCSVVMMMPMWHRHYPMPTYRCCMKQYIQSVRDWNKLVEKWGK